VTPNWFSKDDAIAMHLILVNANLHMFRMLDFKNTCWVVDLGNVTNDEGSTSTLSIMFQHLIKVVEPRSWCLMRVNVQ
jgi:hypothetical protein